VCSTASSARVESGEAAAAGRTAVPAPTASAAHTTLASKVRAARAANVFAASLIVLILVLLYVNSRERELRFNRERAYCEYPAQWID
jgi:hypothetical protein